VTTTIDENAHPFDDLLCRVFGAAAFATANAACGYAVGERKNFSIRVVRKTGISSIG
jgi:hypothetical protein